MLSTFVCAAFALATAATGESPRELNNLGAKAFQEGRYAAAESYYRRAIEAWTEPVAKGKTLGNLAVLCRRQGRFDEAESLYAAALDSFAQAGAGESRYAATSLANLAELHRARGRVVEAAATARKALHMTPAGDPAVADRLNTLAAIECDLGRLDSAEALFKRARQALGPADARLAPVTLNLAAIALARHDYAEAEALSREAALLSDRGPVLAAALNNRAQALRLLGDVDAAEPLYRRAVELWEGAGDPDLALGLANLADLEHGRGRHREAVALYRKALAAARERLGAGHPTVAVLLHRFAAVRSAQGHVAESVRLYRQSLPLLERAFGPGDARVREVAGEYRRLLDRGTHRRDAEDAEITQRILSAPR